MTRHVTSGLLTAAPSLLLLALAVIALTGGPLRLPVLGAQSPTRDCAAFDGSAVAAATGADVAQVDWRAEALDDDAGTLTGYRLHTPTTDRGESLTELPVESIFGDQIGALFVYSSDTDNAGSEVHAIDVRTGCDFVLAHAADVARAVTIEPAGQAVYVKSVSREDRADLGVWRYEVGASKGVRVAEPMPKPDPEFGPAWYTDLSWSQDATLLAIDACGQGTCQTRLLEVATGEISDYFGEHGQFIGVTEADVLSFADSETRPSDIVAIDRESGAYRVVAHDAYEAKLDERRATLLVETIEGTTEVQL